MKMTVLLASGWSPVNSEIGITWAEGYLLATDPATLLGRRAPVTKTTVESWLSAGASGGCGARPVLLIGEPYTTDRAPPTSSVEPPGRCRNGSTMSVELTVIVVALSANHHLDRLLVAMGEQSLDPGSFEVLIVGDPQPLESLGHAADVRSCRVVRVPGASLAEAHNLALWAAQGEFVVRIDPDDTVSSDFLEALLAQAGPRRVVLPAIGAYEPGAVTVSFIGELSQQLLARSGTACSFAEFPAAAMIGFGCLMPAEVARTATYPEGAFWVASLLYGIDLCAANPLALVVPPIDRLPVYRRTTPVDDLDSAALIETRLAAIAAIDTLRRPGLGQSTLARLRRALIAHLGAAARGQAEQWRAVTARIEDLGLSDGERAVLNHAAADKLVVSYAFPPTLDTSGLVVAKRMLLLDEPYDLVVKSGTGFRDHDPRALALIKGQLGERHVIEQRYIDVKMPVIESFINRGLAALEPRHRSWGVYPELYSRAMWPPAHIFAAAYKVSHPETHWIAEFSDPLLIGIDGERKYRLMQRTDWARTITAAARARGVEVPDTNYWEWVESITYALADEVVFTNELQRDLQRSCVAGPALGQRLDEVSRVQHHPTLPRPYYSLASSDYELEPGRIHLGYFGIFYASRGAGDVFQALRQVSPQVRSKVMLHIFTNRPEETSQIVAEAELDDCVRVNRYVPYFEFLNLATRLDWLLVTDAKAIHLFGFNPYRPSKYADYLGSGSKIWAVVEPGSLLSRAEVAACTELGDVAAAAEFLTGIAG